MDMMPTFKNLRIYLYEKKEFISYEFEIYS